MSQLTELPRARPAARAPGALIVGVMTGFGVAFLVAPLSHGPRLVEADDPA